MTLLDGRLSGGFNALRGVFTLSKGDNTIALTRMVEANGPLRDLPETHVGLGRPDGEPPYLNPFGLADDMPIHIASDAASEAVDDAYLGQVLRNEGCEVDWCRASTLDDSVSGWSEHKYLDALGSEVRTGQAGGGFENAATRDGDLTQITVDDERYEIPDAIIFGG
ncbi:hypothetical protein ACFORG_06025 [Lutimaribacter marinistellae]|uniref:Uncharacterized protein n=1 Tax=Lutimaribacter marinistellae TaxID=1820329 RepID=A0ABV7TCL7_9RHOB